VAEQNAKRCKVPGCGRPHHARGFCQVCYDNQRKKGKPGLSGAGGKKNPRDEKKDFKDRKALGDRGSAQETSKIKNPQKRASEAGEGTEQKSARLTLIKTRHEAIKREIDQIREDLEAEEEE
jgi:hypothetical protein